MQCYWKSALLLALVAIPCHSQQTTQPTDTPVPMDQWQTNKINPPKMLRGTQPDFPFEARPRRINGRCLINITVGTYGMPQNIRLIICTDPIFEKNSLDAVKQYRFKPATTQDGKPVDVVFPVDFEFRMVNGQNPPFKVSYGINSPPGITSPDPDASGVYPLTMMADPPIMTKFSSANYGAIAFRYYGNSACDIVLIISANGKAYDPHVTQCEHQVLENPAVQSLLDSEFRPGIVNGKAVPMRVSIHIEYGVTTKDYPSPVLKSRTQGH